MGVSKWAGMGASRRRSDADEAFSWFFSTQYETVTRTVFLLVHDAQRAEDISQEAFTQLLVHWRKVSAYDHPEAWVRRVAIRIAVRHLRRERLRALLEKDAKARPHLPEAADVDVLNAVAALPRMQRAVVVLFYFEDRPMEEIAQTLGCSSSTGWVHLHRARKRLAHLLGEEVHADVR